MYLFQHLFSSGPSFFKDQIGHLMIAVENEGKREKLYRQQVSPETAMFLEYVHSLDREFTAQDLVNRFGLKMDSARSKLHFWVKKPELYRVKKAGVRKNISYYEVIE